MFPVRDDKTSGDWRRDETAPVPSLPDDHAPGALSAEPPAVVSPSPAGTSRRREFTPGALVASRFRIVSLLGRGGMGDVYLAEDTRLGRSVALKLLSPELAPDAKAIQRFEREARTGARLNHPRIATIHDFCQIEDCSFIAMEYIDGKTLEEILQNRRTLPLAEIWGIAIGITEGLAAAHELGIVHRDLKPGNVMVARGGQVKVLDFGIARALHEATPPEGRMDSTGLTAEGSILGTVNYMSPEQVRGHPLDGRSDLFSLGTVLFEMSAGAPPFQRNSAADTLSAILNDPPGYKALPGPTIPAAVARIVEKLLAKDPRDRFPSAAEVLRVLDREKTALESGAAAAASRGTTKLSSVAVLPFLNMSQDRENEFFADGITEDIITALSQVRTLRVPARTSTFAFKGKSEDLRRIGEVLGVTHVVEGSVRKAGNKVRITAQLLKLDDESQLWSDRFDRKLKDVFEIQDEIVRAIVEALKVQFGGPAIPTLAARHSADPFAYQLYLQGRSLLNRRGAELKKALHYLELALLEDPGYALAECGLAEAYNFLGFYDFLSPLEACPKAKAAALRALALNDGLAETHAALGYCRMIWDWDWAAAESEFRKALTLDPNNAITRSWYAIFLSSQGRFEKGIAENQRAIDLDPLSVIPRYTMGWIFCHTRRFDEAIDAMQKALEIDPGAVMAHVILATANAEEGRFDEAIVAQATALKGMGVNSWALSLLGEYHARAGHRDAALEILAELEARARQSHLRALHLARLRAALGDVDECYRWLEKAIEERDPHLPWLHLCWPYSERSDPRFAAFMRRIGLGD